MGFRPSNYEIHAYTWRNGADLVPGYLVQVDGRVKLHLTAAEAVQMSNDLLDLIESDRKERQKNEH